ncbi:hypothetical protein HDV05_007012 [Chytridiales sp. JEL 0842]|nr:hypothetical protein HDV05_007012 [Chytridiales sp. JEL 0842]
MASTTSFTVFRIRFFTEIDDGFSQTLKSITELADFLQKRHVLMNDNFGSLQDMASSFSESTMAALDKTLETIYNVGDKMNGLSSMVAASKDTVGLLSTTLASVKLDADDFSNNFSELLPRWFSGIGQLVEETKAKVEESLSSHLSVVDSSMITVRDNIFDIAAALQEMDKGIRNNVFMQKEFEQLASKFHEIQRETMSTANSDLVKVLDNIKTKADDMLGSISAVRDTQLAFLRLIFPFGFAHFEPNISGL